MPGLPAGSSTFAAAGLPNLAAMLHEMTLAPSVVRPSAFWEFLNSMNLEQLASSGFADFKRTINQNYFNFLPRDPRDPQFRAVLGHWLRRPRLRALAARLLEPDRFEHQTTHHNPFRRRAARAGYALFVALLWEYARTRDRMDLLERLQEPDLGRPLYVRHGDRLITQDLCNSVLEFHSIIDALPSGRPAGRGVLELGAGYGRLAWVFLHVFPECPYFICDIPPALAVAETYLTTLFPDRRVFRFRHFDTHADVRKEMEQAQLGFLMPNQLALVPPWGAGLFVNVSSLHEMRPEQIEYYLAEVSRHTHGYFYSKQWIRSFNRHDGITIGREDYPIPAAWEEVYNRRHPVQTGFFEALYRVHG